MLFTPKPGSLGHSGGGLEVVVAPGQGWWPQEVVASPEVSIMMLLSASGGRTSTSALLCLWRATEALGFRSSRSMVLKIRT